MAKLIYSVITSLDGYNEDEHGNFDWSAPDDEVHQYINDLERSNGTYLLGRRTYETMRVWDSDAAFIDESPIYRDFASIWQAAEKIIYSKTLDHVSARKTRIEREFNPDAVRRMKDTASSDLMIGGPQLAASAFKAGLIDVVHLFLAPVIVGGGKKAFPEGVLLPLTLVESRRFASGMVHLRYQAG